MSSLLTIAIGPVQDFIAAARRTADLQAGSTMLVETAKVVTRAVKEAGGELIFPSSPDTDGPNKILVKLNIGDPAEVARKAESAARDFILQQWHKHVDALPQGIRNTLDEQLAAGQVKAFLEFYAAWLPIGEHDYARTREEVDRLLAGRKALRDFDVPVSLAGQPKSPLDPSRDCALRVGKEFTVPKACTGHPLWLKPRETLDAISLLKRINGVAGVEHGLPRTPSTSLMAARPVLQAAEAKAPNELDQLRKLERRTNSGVDMGDFLFPGRLEKEELEKQGFTPDEIDKTIPTLRRDLLKKTLDRTECPPYYAILAADGDRMGKLLSALPTMVAHQHVSGALSEFAQVARHVVHNMDGHAIYTGGDDVLALLPVNRAVECGAALAKAFQQQIGALVPQSGEKLDCGTLSVGIAVVHCMDPLQISLARAREAEHQAKEYRNPATGKTRNALAVAVHTRGGEPRNSAASWDNKPDAEWQRLVSALQGDDLSRGFPYELHELARKWRDTDIPVERLAFRLRDEAERVLQRKRGGDEARSPEVKSLAEDLRRLSTPAELEQFANKLVIARFLAGYEMEKEAPHG